MRSSASSFPIRDLAVCSSYSKVQVSGWRHSPRFGANSCDCARQVEKWWCSLLLDSIPKRPCLQAPVHASLWGHPPALRPLDLQFIPTTYEDFSTSSASFP